MFIGYQHTFLSAPRQPWPEEALERVANSFLQPLDMKDNERKEVVPICKTFHTSASQLSARCDTLNITQSKVTYMSFCLHFCFLCRFLTELGRHNYVTPTSYLELMAAFSQLLTKKRDAVMKAKRRYTNGLEKLAFAESQVYSLSQFD